VVLMVLTFLEPFRSLFYLTNTFKCPFRKILELFPPLRATLFASKRMFPLRETVNFTVFGNIA